jgi:hypothetical protein
MADTDLSQYLWPDAAQGRQAFGPGYGINWDDPEVASIAQGLTSVFAPGISNFDLITVLKLGTVSGGAAAGVGASEAGLKLTASNASIYGTATAAQKSAAGTLLWFGDLYASPSGDACLGGITNNSANTSPYVMMELKRNYSNANPSRIYFSLSNGGTLNNNNLSSSANYASGNGCIFIGTSIAGSQALYSGKIGQALALDASTAAAGALQSTSTSRYEVGDSLNARNPQALCNLQMTWGRALSAKEAEWIGLNLRRFFAPQTQIPLWVDAGVATVTAASGTYAWSGVLATLTPSVTATPGTYTWAGIPASLAANLSTTPGAYSWSGVPATLAASIVSLPGSYTWAGVGATLAGGVNANPGAYTWAGVPSLLTAIVPAVVGQWTWAGTTATFGAAPTYAKNSNLYLSLGSGLSMMLGLPRLSNWNILGRPSSPLPYTVGFNTDTSKLEMWNGTAWVGTLLS